MIGQNLAIDRVDTQYSPTEFIAHCRHVQCPAPMYGYGTAGFTVIYTTLKANNGKNYGSSSKIAVCEFNFLVC